MAPFQPPLRPCTVARSLFPRHKPSRPWPLPMAIATAPLSAEFSPSLLRPRSSHRTLAPIPPRSRSPSPTPPPVRRFTTPPMAPFQPPLRLCTVARSLFPRHKPSRPWPLPVAIATVPLSAEFSPSLLRPRFSHQSLAPIPPRRLSPSPTPPPVPRFTTPPMAPFQPPLRLCTLARLRLRRHKPSRPWPLPVAYATVSFSAEFSPSLLRPRFSHR